MKSKKTLNFGLSIGLQSLLVFFLGWFFAFILDSSKIDLSDKGIELVLICLISAAVSRIALRLEKWTFFLAFICLLVWNTGFFWIGMLTFFGEGP